jgi:hypothetical protein
VLERVRYRHQRGNWTTHVSTWRVRVELVGTSLKDDARRRSGVVLDSSYTSNSSSWGAGWQPHRVSARFPRLDSAEPDASARVVPPRGQQPLNLISMEGPEVGVEDQDFQRRVRGQESPE